MSFFFLIICRGLIATINHAELLYAITLFCTYCYLVLQQFKNGE